MIRSTISCARELTYAKITVVSEPLPQCAHRYHEHVIERVLPLAEALDRHTSLPTIRSVRSCP